MANWEISPESVKGEGIAIELIKIIRKIAQCRSRIGAIVSEIEALRGCLKSQEGTIYCSSLANISNENLEKVIEFINSQIQPNVDARIFEIVSYAILKAYYSEQIIYWGSNINDLIEENLKLYIANLPLIRYNEQQYL